MGSLRHRSGQRGGKFRLSRCCRLRNLAADAETEYISDGITETLIHSLAQLSGLRVIARSTAFRYKGSKADPQNIGRELNVGAVLAGRILQRGDGLVVTAELVDVANGWQLWGKKYDRKAQDILSVQDEIAQEVSERLRLALSGQDKKAPGQAAHSEYRGLSPLPEGAVLLEQENGGRTSREASSFSNGLSKKTRVFALAHARGYPIRITCCAVPV